MLSNADGNPRETHDDESALHSDWGSDESIRESIGDGCRNSARAFFIELRKFLLSS